jgi:predicted MPP superfamily phosphohydrolase
VQISDFHLGTFAGIENRFQKVVDMINEQNPDLIVFTGDAVNNFADEIIPCIPIFSQLKARDGILAVLGNHDYGGYYKWKNASDSIANHEKIKSNIKQMGFTLLNNQAVKISRCDSDVIAIVGTENWGKVKRFPKRADLDKALEQVQDIPFKILLTHNPEFWSQKVKDKTDIALTLAGHIHGTQIGIKLGKKRYGMANMLRSAYLVGLYRSDKQYLYVNRGLGSTNFLARIGMTPEITVITVKKKCETPL